MKKRTRGIDVGGIKPKTKTREDFENELNELRVMLVKKAQDCLKTGNYDELGNILKSVKDIDRLNPKPEGDVFMDALKELNKTRNVGAISDELVDEAEKYLTHLEDGEDVLLITEGPEDV